MRNLAIVAIALIGSALTCAAQKIEVKSADLRSNQNDAQSLVVPEGKVLEVVDFFVTNGQTATPADGTQAVMETTPETGTPRPMLLPRQWNASAPVGGARTPLRLLGPLSLRVRAEVGSNVRYFLYYRLIDNVDTAATQTGQTVVIPDDASGDVEIILESSKDLVNWTAANPGTYNSETTDQRFFRVRAEKKPAQ